MSSAVTQSLPIISLVVLGFLLKQVGIIHPGDGNVMARFIINTTLPAVIFLSIAQADVSPARMAVLVLCGLAIPLGLRVVAGYLVQWLGLERRLAGVVILATMATNIGFFLYPFFLSVYGHEGISRLAAFDIGNSLVANSYGFYIATCYGEAPPSGLRDGLQRVLTMPTLWAGLLGLAANLSGIHLPPLANNVLETLGAANTPLAMLTLGAFIQLKNANWKPIGLAVGLRMGLGFLLGQVLVGLVGLSGIERAVVSIGAAMPIGLAVLVYAASEGMDAELAAGAVSLSILVGLVITPLLLAVY